MGLLKLLYTTFFGPCLKMMKSGVTSHLPEKAISYKILPLLNVSSVINCVTDKLSSSHFPNKNIDIIPNAH
jgi:hypothetical protein